MQRLSKMVPGGIVMAGLLLLIAPGCEPRKQALRSGLTDVEPPADPVKDDPTFRRPQDLDGFFKKNRYAGTLSSEAQEIETNLGILK